jgi:hypothetical protein
LHKRGIDYDFINAAQAASGTDVEYREMWEDMVMWDAKMQVDSLKGMDRSVDHGGEVFYSGRINTN